MRRGDRVVRVSESSTAPGRIDEQGTIEATWSEGGEVYGIRVVWDSKPKESQYLMVSRVAVFEQWRPRQLEQGKTEEAVR